MKTPQTRSRAITPLHQKDMVHTRIISEAGTEQHLDTIQLSTLEQSYRDWIKASPRSDIRLSRKRILLIFLLIRYTGAKLNEILSLDPFEDIDFGRNLAVLRGKQTKSRVPQRKIPIPRVLSREIQSTVSDPAFAKSIHTGLAVDPGFVRRKLYERAESCGFDKKLGGPELIRKARAVELLRGNMPLPAVQNLLGHSTPNLTESMVSFSEKEMRRLTQLFMEQESDRKTSARNSFFGKIAAITPGDVLTKVDMATIDGFCVTATITNNSRVQLGLKKEKLVTAEIKAPWVILQKMGPETLSCTAENRFEGVVSQVNQGKIHTECVVAISDVTELCSIVTTESVRQLTLKDGDRVLAMFNSFAVVLQAG